MTINSPALDGYVVDEGRDEMAGILTRPDFLVRRDAEAAAAARRAEERREGVAGALGRHGAWVMACAFALAFDVDPRMPAWAAVAVMAPLANGAVWSLARLVADLAAPRLARSWARDLADLFEPRSPSPASWAVAYVSCLPRLAVAVAACLATATFYGAAVVVGIASMAADKVGLGRGAADVG